MTNTIFDQYYATAKELETIQPRWEESQQEQESFRKRLNGSVFAKLVDSYQTAYNKHEQLWEKLQVLEKREAELKKEIFTFFKAHPSLSEVKVEFDGNTAPVAIRPNIENYEIKFTSILR